MYKVNVTPADSFNDSGCGQNYEHDEEHNEEHDEGDDSHLNFDSISTGNLLDVVLSNKSKHPALQKLYDEYKTFMNEKHTNFEAYKLHSEWAEKVIGFCKSNKINTSKTLLQKITELSKQNPGLIHYVTQADTVHTKKDKFAWNKEVLGYCKNNKIDLGPKPARNPKKQDKVAAKAHHLSHFSVEEHTGEHGPYLKISYKKHRHREKHPGVPFV